MLTVLHPNLIPLIKKIPIGILSFCLNKKEKPILVVKAPKEYILAAKIKESLHVYLLPVVINDQKNYGLVTAFFDDEDEPLIITTPLFSDEHSLALLESLQSEQLNVHFFDELSREHLVYRASVIIPPETQQNISELNLVKFSLPNARIITEDVVRMFGLRTSKDDGQAITISLDESIYGDGLFIQDIRHDRHTYNGSRGFSHTILEREEPGSYQEEDIIQCLLRIFPPKQIYLSPKRTYDKEEICDILVVTETQLLIIQAKDSPNIERINQQSLSRKRSNVLKALKKAVDQVKGAIGYYNRVPNKIEFLIEGKQHSINTKQLEVKALIVVKELFNDQYGEYSPLIFDIFKNKTTPCIALDYPEFNQYCSHLNDEDEFFDAYNTVTRKAIEHGEFPRLRFGFTENN